MKGFVFIKSISKRLGYDIVFSVNIMVWKRFGMMVIGQVRIFIDFMKDTILSEDLELCFCWDLSSYADFKAS